MPPLPVVAAGMTVSTAFVVVAVLAIVAQSVVLLVALFDRGLRYEIDQPELHHMDDPAFLHTLEALTDARPTRDARLEVLTNGERFYEAELQAIRNAQTWRSATGPLRPVWKRILPTTWRRRAR